MPKFAVQVDGGRDLDIEADDFAVGEHWILFRRRRGADFENLGAVPRERVLSVRESVDQ